MIDNFIKYIEKNEKYIIFDIGSRDCLQSIEFYKVFDIEAEKPKDFDFDVLEFSKTLETKYMNIFEVAGEYNSLHALADIINFIDEKS